MTANREPWLAALLGFTVPGAGHFYAGAPTAGIAFLVAGLALLVVAAWQFFAPSGSMPLGGASLGALLALFVLSSVAAHRRAARVAAPPPDTGPGSGRDAWKAVFFSALYPGLGQFLARRPLPGIAFLALGLVSSLAGSWPLELAHSAVRGASMLDAWRGGDLRRDSAFRTVRTVVLALTLLVAAQLTFIAFARARLVRAFRIPSESMAPTLVPGDYLFADLTRRGRAEPGEIVVFRYPPDPSKIYLDRCVAVGGQTIEVRDKVVRVDGRPLVEPYARHIDPLVRTEAGPRDNMPAFTVPPGSYFVMGDNRDNSYDSRFWGPVPADLVLGRPYKIYWPLDRAGPLRRR